MVNSETTPEAWWFARCGFVLEEGWAVDRVQGVPGPLRGDVGWGQGAPWGALSWPVPGKQKQCSVQFSSVQSLSRVWLFVTHGLQHTRLPCPSPTPRAHSNSCPLSRWCGPIISSSVVPFSSCLQSFPASGSFPRSQFFTSGGQSIGVSASTSVLPMNIQDWFPLGYTDWISLQSKGLSRVFPSTTVQKHQFFGSQLSL